MSMNRIVEVLMRRDGLDEESAIDLMIEARWRILEEGENPRVVLRDDFGLEGDYIDDLV